MAKVFVSASPEMVQLYFKLSRCVLSYLCSLTSIVTMECSSHTTCCVVVHTFTGDDESICLKTIRYTVKCKCAKPSCFYCNLPDSITREALKLVSLLQKEITAQSHWSALLVCKPAQIPRADKLKQMRQSGNSASGTTSNWMKVRSLTPFGYEFVATLLFVSRHERVPSASGNLASWSLLACSLQQLNIA